MSEDMVGIWEAVRKTLDEMAGEAQEPYWLRCFPSYYKEKFPGCFRNDEYESVMTERLAQGLSGKPINGKAMHACPERKYPTRHEKPNERCDLVIGLDGITVVWIECKSAYTDKLRKDFKAENARWDTDNWEDTVRGIRADVERLKKLAELRPPVTICIGVLLLGFDRKDNQISTDKLYRLLPDELERDWIAAHGKDRREGVPPRQDRCESRANRGFRERVWFWYRAVNE
jgi:hypothetical protein